MARPSNREKVLEAAEAVATELGAANLTLDSVAERAGFSKGGLLYHFKDKDALLTALVERYVQRRMGESDKRLQEVGDTPVARLKLKITHNCADKAGCSRLQMGLIAACANNPELAASVRPIVRETVGQLRKGFQDSDAAITLLLAADGLVLHDLLRFQTFNAQERKAFVEHLLRAADTLKTNP